MSIFATKKVTYKLQKTMAIHFTLQKNNIKSNSAYGKYYAHTVKQGELTMSDIERQIQERCTVTRADVRAVLTALEDVVAHGLKDGMVVNLNELGKFYLSIRSESVDTPEDFHVRKHVKEVVCKYTPAGHRQPMSGGSIKRSFTSGCTLVQDTPPTPPGQPGKRIRRGGKL